MNLTKLFYPLALKVYQEYLNKYSYDSIEIIIKDEDLVKGPFDTDEEEFRSIVENYYYHEENENWWCELVCEIRHCGYDFGFPSIELPNQVLHDFNLLCRRMKLLRIREKVRNKVSNINSNSILQLKMIKDEFVSPIINNENTVPGDETEDLDKFFGNME